MEIKNEMCVIVTFAQQAKAAGFEIVSIRADYPDAEIKHNGQIYRTEFEYRSSSFFLHGHDERECDLVICWFHDSTKLIVPVLELSNPDWTKQTITLVSDEMRELGYLRRLAEIQQKEIENLRATLEIKDNKKSPNAIIERREQVSRMNAIGISKEHIAAYFLVSPKTIERDLQTPATNGVH